MKITSTEAVVQRSSVKKIFLEISQDCQESTCARVSFLIEPEACNFIKKETLAHGFPVNLAKFLGTPTVAASASKHLRHEFW